MQRPLEGGVDAAEGHHQFGWPGRSMATFPTAFAV
jgi:hypothetical protein